MGRKVCHVKEEKQNILEEVVGEGGKKRAVKGEQKACVRLCAGPLVAQAQIPLPVCQPAHSVPSNC